MLYKGIIIIKTSNAILNSSELYQTPINENATSVLNVGNYMMKDT
jgi:hypothetical protein